MKGARTMCYHYFLQGSQGLLAVVVAKEGLVSNTYNRMNLLYLNSTLSISFSFTLQLLIPLVPNDLFSGLTLFVLAKAVVLGLAMCAPF